MITQSRFQVIGTIVEILPGYQDSKILVIETEKDRFTSVETFKDATETAKSAEIGQPCLAEGWVSSRKSEKGMWFTKATCSFLKLEELPF